ncbi:DUF5647 family protein [Thermus scotoductus]|nr:DUF5647 family protein [Thermus scotoductus]
MGSQQREFPFALDRRLRLTLRVERGKLVERRLGLRGHREGDAAMEEKEARFRMQELYGRVHGVLLDLELAGRLPESYRLVILPLDEPGVAAYALAVAQAPNPENLPLVHALFWKGELQTLLLPGGEAIRPQVA